MLLTITLATIDWNERRSIRLIDFWFVLFFQRIFVASFHPCWTSPYIGNWHHGNYRHLSSMYVKKTQTLDGLDYLTNTLWTPVFCCKEFWDKYAVRVIIRVLLHYWTCCSTLLDAFNYIIGRVVLHIWTCCSTLLDAFNYIIGRVVLHNWTCYTTYLDVL